jgi:anti-sigma B factor antagonist
MKIEARNEKGVTVLSLKGKITIGIGDVALREAIREALAAGARSILLDMTGVSTIDSSGVGELVQSQGDVAANGGALRLANLPNKVVDLLQMTQLIQTFDTFDTVEEGIASFQ